jgi:hypothetical protein
MAMESDSDKSRDFRPGEILNAYSDSGGSDLTTKPQSGNKSGQTKSD